MCFFSAFLLRFFFFRFHRLEASASLPLVELLVEFESQEDEEELHELDNSESEVSSWRSFTLRFCCAPGSRPSSTRRTSLVEARLATMSKLPNWPFFLALQSIIQMRGVLEKTEDHNREDISTR